MCVGNQKWRDLLLSSVYQKKKKRKLIVVVEAHTVIQWGEGTEQEEAFRGMFHKLVSLGHCVLEFHCWLLLLPQDHPTEGK